MGCLALALTYAFLDFCLFMLTLVVAQKCTLITSLSEFISVFNVATMLILLSEIPLVIPTTGWLGRQRLR